ncbi:MAG: 3-keto-5-aminohexanoate cleavage protein [Defluviitaleaceae bacterium]|nr:3-keto-5-aminohexanoate cleavage protein [Defluviitaleaceae bacterium]
MDKLIITAAICGAEVTKAHNPAVPYTVDEIGREARLAYEAGASIIHLHVRTDDGTPTQCEARFAECIAEIKRLCPEAIIQPSTGGAVGMSNAERIQSVNLHPEMATLDCGTCNFGGDDIFVNTENTIKEFGKKMLELGVKPEVEVFDKGMIDTALRLNKQGFIASPMHFNFVMGVNGGIAATPRDFTFMRDSIPTDATFTVTGIGRAQFPMAVMGIISGGHVRVGFEDNIYLSKGVLAKSNGELVEKAVRLSHELGREIASPAEARRIIGL